MEAESILGTRTSSRELVPLAERPYAPEDHSETVEETVWLNPGKDDVVLDLYVGIQKGLHQLRNQLRAQGKQLSWEQRTGKRRYIIRAKGQCVVALKDGGHDARACSDPAHPKTTGERAIPSEFDMAIQHHQCLETECSQKPNACKNRTHRKAIVGGLAPAQLVMRGMQHRPVLSNSLNDMHAAEQAAKEKTVAALIQRSHTDVELATAQAELERLRTEIARKDAQATSLSPELRESATRSERAGASAAESRVSNLEAAKVAEEKPPVRKRAAATEPTND